MKNVEDIYPLTPLQRGMLYHTLEAPGLGLYYERLSWTLRGALDAAAFRRAWEQVLTRHPILRIAVVWEDLDEPLQVVRRSVPLPWHEEDWRDLAPAEQEERLRQYLRDDLGRDFDLARAPLMRLALFRLADDAWRLVWGHHHLLLDGWARVIVVRDLFVLYDACRRDCEPQLEPARPFRDYVAWLRQQDLTAAEEFWRRTLGDFSAPTPLGVERTAKAGAAPSAEEGVRDSHLPAAATEALQDFARRQRLTLNTLLQGAWALLLSRYGGERDVVFGAVVSGRPPDLAGVEAMVGPFINTLPVRVRIAPGQPLAEWLRQLQRAQVEQRRYEHSPLVAVQGWSGVPRGRPLFESLFVFENHPLEIAGSDGRPSGRRDEGLEVGDRRYDSRTHYPLTLVAVPGQRLALRVHHDPSRIDATTAARLIGHLHAVLGEFVRRPRERVERVSLLTKAERHALLAEWPGSRGDFPRHACLHELFEAQVGARPEAVALVDGGATGRAWSYRELNRRADRLAHSLRRLGVGPEVAVGIALERCPELVMALLAVLKAGGVYVFLDPAYPEERLAWMIDDAGIAVLVTIEALRRQLPLDPPSIPPYDKGGRPRPSQPPAGRGGALPVVSLDGDERAAVRTTASPAPTPSNRAYVIYTSGSTGKPKGVDVEHRAVVRLVKNTDFADLDAGEVFLLLVAISFDVSTLELWGPLLNGARLVVMPAGATSLEEIGAVVRRHRVTTLWLTAGLFHLMVDHRLGDLRGLRQLIAGGDVLSPPHVARVLAHLPGCRMIDGYGPTENTTFTACKTVRELAGSTVPIGRPIRNSWVRVLNRDLEPVPIGAPGELWIGGEGLARGYHRRSALTAEKFVPDPFATEPSARLYRSGDLVRYRPDGDLEFLGRLDHQVKVRGFRVEPGEVEAALAEHPAVREAVVVARSEGPADQRLVAYLVAADREATPARLRAHLGGRLPAYMVPSVFVTLPELPLNASGKVDRRALPAPDTSALAADGERAAPRTPVEEIIAGIWADLLGVERLGIDDDFFALGGHSLLATQVASRLRNAFGVEVPFRDLFERPTVAGLGASVGDALAAGRDLTAPAIAAVARDAEGDELPLSFAQQRLWFLAQLEPESPIYNIPITLHLEGRLEPAALADGLAAVVRRHESLRTTFGSRDGRPRQRIGPFRPPVLPLVDLRALAAERRTEEAMRWAVAAARRPFDLEAGPLWRIALLRLASEEFVLLFTMHHVVSDGWSMGVFVSELARLYRAATAGLPAELPELPIQYADFARWQRQWLRGEVLETHLAYWRRQLAGVTTLPLPTDRPRPALLSPRGGRWRFSLPAEPSRELARLGARAGATLFMTLVAAFKVLLRRYSGQDDVVVGTDVANRNRTEIEGLIGFFVNQLALRTTVAAGACFEEVLRGVREVALEGYLHQDLPFERLVEELRIERDLSRNPLFQVVFALEVPRPVLDLPEVALKPLPVSTVTAKLDLTVVLAETRSGLEGTIEYSIDLFDRATVGRMAAHFAVLLRAVVADPERRVVELPLLDPGQRHQLVVEWNDSRAPWPAERSYPTLFASQVARTPDEPAAICAGETLTYRELNRRANVVARSLVAAGVGPDSVVALLDRRGLDLLTAILGVFKAGGAYLPLDPYHPAERHAQILARSACRLVLAGSEFLATTAAACDALVGRPRVLELGELVGRELDGDDPPCRQQPAHLAYVIYTSGSTGVPKGVMVTQEGMINHLFAKISALGVTAADTVVQNASQCFDVSVWQFLAALLVGGRVHVAGDDVALDGVRLLHLVGDERISIFETVPSMLRVMLADPAAAGTALPALRWLLPTGEALPPELCREWLARYPEVPLVNAYGPTECSDDVTHHLVARPPAPEATNVAIGRPISNLRIHLLDDSLRPVAPGVIGELCAGGVGLGRGYLGAPAVTAAAFVPDPTAEVPGARLYRTGDLARRRHDGRIEFLGRIDHQVKVRGFRIELGEVETLLAQIPEVREAVVTVHEEPGGSPRLVAYLVPAEGPETARGTEGAIDRWREIFAETYSGDAASQRDSGVNLKLWISSYTGRSLPEEEILECVEDSVARILALRPERVLEIGCGTGLLLKRIAPRCRHYWGTDFSAEVLDPLRRKLGELAASGVEIELLERPADDFTGLPQDFFDLVVINEVVQYFPSADYLVAVVEGAARIVRPGGSIFVGGVRSQPLLEAFHASVQGERAAAELDVAELRERVRSHLEREKELTVAPELFALLARRLPQLTSAGVELKGGRHGNELTRFRYDVTLMAGTDRLPAVAVPEHDWRREGWTLEALRRRLAADRPPVLRFTAIPNARVAADVALVELLAAPGGLGNADELRQAARNRAAERDPVDPTALRELGRELGYRVALGWTRSTPDGAYDALLCAEGEAEAHLVAVAPESAEPWSRYANNPMAGDLARELVPRIRDHLLRKLPEYMVPSAMVLLEALPLLPNGKVDRKALPAPDRTRPELNGAFVAPRNRDEERLAEIFQDLLGVDRIGVYDGFFELGGHSLLATQVASRVRTTFRRELSLQEIFDRPTVAQLAATLAERAGTAVDEEPAIERLARRQYRTSRAVLDPV